MRYAIINNNVIENFVDWDGASPSTLPSGRTIALAQNVFANIGWFWNNGAPTDPNPPAPPVPFDFGNFDNLDKTLKAFALVVRDYTNALQAGTHTQKTINQVKADFLAKFNSLP